MKELKWLGIALIALIAAEQGIRLFVAHRVEQQQQDGMERLARQIRDAAAQPIITPTHYVDAQGAALAPGDQCIAGQQVRPTGNTTRIMGPCKAVSR